jgi:hypothetical protein
MNPASLKGKNIMLGFHDKYKIVVYLIINLYFLIID